MRGRLHLGAGRRLHVHGVLLHPMSCANQHCAFENRLELQSREMLCLLFLFSVMHADGAINTSKQKYEYMKCTLNLM